MDQIVVFDVETPNGMNDRICSLGIAVVENGEIMSRQHFLVNPECKFDPRNIQIHGIHPEKVADAPTFPAIWEQVQKLFHEKLVAAHNTGFDLCVLKKTLRAYDIDESMVYYVDTLAMARAEIESESYKLPALCARFGIPLNHHDAGSDSSACASLLIRFLKAGVDINHYIKSYRLDADVAPSAAHTRRQPSAETQALLTLNGILGGITSDGMLVPAEVDYLQNWMDENESLKGNYPYDKIYATLAAALADGILEQFELDDMLRLFKQVTDPVNECACACEKLDISGKNICLSGEFDHGSKAEISEKLAGCGATVCTSVTKKLDILLVGGQGSEAWSAGNYGTKVKKAMELQAKGSNILLIKEADFFTALGE